MIKCKVLIFDLWNTLIETKEYDPWELTGNILGLNKYDIKSKARMTWMRQKKMTPLVFINDFLQVPCTDAQKKKIQQIWNEFPEHAYWMPYAKETLEKLKQNGFILFIVSNTIPQTKIIIDKLEIERHVSNPNIILSCDFGIIKPDIRLFQKVLNNLPYVYRAMDCCVIGDKIETDILGADIWGSKKIRLDINESQVLSQEKDGIIPDAIIPCLSKLPELLMLDNQKVFQWDIWTLNDSQNRIVVILSEQDDLNAGLEILNIAPITKYIPEDCTQNFFINHEDLIDLNQDIIPGQCYIELWNQMTLPQIALKRRVASIPDYISKWLIEAFHCINLGEKVPNEIERFVQLKPTDDETPAIKEFKESEFEIFGGIADEYFRQFEELEDFFEDEDLFDMSEDQTDQDREFDEHLSPLLKATFVRELKIGMHIWSQHNDYKDRIEPQLKSLADDDINNEKLKNILKKQILICKECEYFYYDYLTLKDEFLHYDPIESRDPNARPDFIPKIAITPNETSNIINIQEFFLKKSKKDQEKDKNLRLAAAPTHIDETVPRIEESDSFSIVGGIGTLELIDDGQSVRLKIEKLEKGTYALVFKDKNMNELDRKMIKVKGDGIIYQEFDINLYENLELIKL